jgi:hypothetical protein
MHDEHAALIIKQGLRQLAASDDVERELIRMLPKLAHDPWTHTGTAGDELGPEGKPAWWWRFRLIEWAGSSQAGDRCDEDALRAFRLYVRDLSSQELCQFIGQALERRQDLKESA